MGDVKARLTLRDERAAVTRRRIADAARTLFGSRGYGATTLKAVADLTGGTYHPAESAAELESVFASLPTSLITKHEVNEIGFVFVALGALLAAVSVLLGRLWRPLP